MWCTDLPHLLHLLTFLSLLGYVSPPRVSIPCHAFPSSQQVSTVVQMAFYGNAREGCVRICGMCVVHIPAPSCALADIPFSRELCLPATCFPPVLWFFRHRA